MKHPSNEKEQIRMDIFQLLLCASQNVSRALRKMLPGKVWQHPHGYLAARLSVRPYFAVRKMLPGRVWQRLERQPATRIGT
jgi:hypothetical protein